MLRRLEAPCARRRLAYTTHGILSVNFMDQPNLDHHRRVAMAMVDVTAAVGASVMVHHPGLAPAADEATIQRLTAVECDELRRLGDHAAARGVHVAVETLFVEDERSHTPDPFELAALLRAVDHEAVVGTLDVSHSFIMSRFKGLDPEAGVAAFAPVAGHVHLHDSFGLPTTVQRFFASGERQAFGMGDLHLPLGWGDLPFATLLPSLSFLPGTVLNVELPERYWAEIGDVAAAARGLVDDCNETSVRR